MLLPLEGEGLQLVRSGRHLWVEHRNGQANGQFAASGIAVLFVHGACAHHGQWERVESALRVAGVATLTFDALGCGRSHKPRRWDAYEPQQHYADLTTLFDTLEKSYKAVVVVGHSFGAALSLCLAARNKRVAGVALISSFCPPTEPQAPPILSLRRWLFYLPDWILGWLQPGLTEGFLAAAFAIGTRETNKPLVEQERTMSNRNPPYMFKAFYRQMGNFGKRSDIEGWARSCQQPAVVIYGDSDRITPLHPNSGVLMRNLARAELAVIPAAGHQVMQEMHSAVATVLLKLIGRVSAEVLQ